MGVRHTRRRSRGMTLTELLVAVALSGVVMIPVGILMVSLVRMQDSARRAQEASMRSTLALTQIEAILMDAESFTLGYKGGIPSDASIQVTRQNGSVQGIYWDLNTASQNYLSVVHEQLTPTPPSNAGFPRIIADAQKVVRVSDFRLARQNTSDPSKAMFVQIWISVGFGPTGENDKRELMTRIFLPNKY